MLKRSANAEWFLSAALHVRSLQTLKMIETRLGCVNTNSIRRLTIRKIFKIAPLRPECSSWAITCLTDVEDRTRSSVFTCYFAASPPVPNLVPLVAGWAHVDVEDESSLARVMSACTKGLRWDVALCLWQEGADLGWPEEVEGSSQSSRCEDLGGWRGSKLKERWGCIWPGGCRKMLWTGCDRRKLRRDTRNRRVAEYDIGFSSSKACATGTP